ncbi:hypothetical protein [Agitococcus lubricus]|uniref:Uncharacterized protein n=1 Tax=Agitococcus lubricus TaxID=1077255 RepID=A0A2T5J041_9GAMM|nr:hypothetical protein [Agitococcus lubricus]PTQ89697.1 hypothetical protein C8N29_10520 [Agitococcus lubricus]
MNEAIINPEVFSLASQLYVRMRRFGRVVDAVYMAQNNEYAHEILRIAARETDAEILDIVARFEALLARTEEKAKPVAVTPTVVEPQVPVLDDMVHHKEPEKEKLDIFSMTLRPLRKKQVTLPEIPVAEVVVHKEEIEEEVAHHYIGALR